MPSIPASGSATVFLYYGNASAASLSDGYNTFRFFDDFEKWIQNPAWEAKQELPTPMADVTCAVYNDKLYVFGGYNDTPTDALDETYAYDPELNTWEVKANMPTPRWGQIAVEFNGKIYVFGGRLANRSGSNANEVYDPENNTWMSMATGEGPQPMPDGISHEGITGVRYGDKIHLFYRTYHYEYDPVYDTYTPKASVPLELSWSTCATVGTKIYIIGGFSYEEPVDASNVNFEYNPATDSWETKASIPEPAYRYGTPRENPVINGKIYITHGRQGIGFYATNYEYDPATDTWKEKYPALLDRDGVGGGVINNKLYVVGGRRDNDGPYGLTFNEVYDPWIDSRWATSGSSFVFVDGSAKYRGDYGLIIRQTEDVATFRYAESMDSYGSTYALDFYWNVTDIGGIGGTKPETEVRMSEIPDIAENFLFYNVSPTNEQTLSWYEYVSPGNGTYIPLQVGTRNEWHKVSMVREGANHFVTFDENTYGPLTGPGYGFGTGKFRFGLYFATTQYIDNIRVRKWAGDDPITTVGTEVAGSSIWTGGGSDNNWNTTGNWDNGVPASVTNATIPPGGTMPVVTMDNAICNNLVIDAGASVLINPGGALEVNGNLTNNGTLTIESTGVSLSGSLIVNGTSTGNVTYNRTIPDDGGMQHYHYISSPVTPANITSTKEFYPYDEEAGDWGSAIVSPYIGVESGKGYTVIGGGSISFTGAIVTTDLAKTVTSPYYTAVGDGSRADYDARWAAGRSNYGGGGFNLLGNPYTSAMSATEFITENIEQFDPYYAAVYLYNGTSYNYIGAPVEGWDVDNPTQLAQTNIQAGQGFFVLAEQNNTQFTFKHSMQEHSTTATLLKSARVGNRWPGMRLNAKSGEASGSTLVLFNKEMTTGLDEGYDVGMMSAGADLEIYTKMLEGGDAVNLARQAIPENVNVRDVIPVGIDFAQGGKVVFSAEVEPLKSRKFWLEDRSAGVYTDLGLSSYTVTLPANTSGTGRFFVHVTAGRPDRPGKKQPALNELKIWSSQNRIIYIQGNVTEKAVCEVYDIHGQKIYETLLNDTEYNIINMTNVKKGVYLVTVRDGLVVVTKRVVL